MSKGSKSVDAQIAEKEEEIRKLKEQQAKLRLAGAPQYPKHIQVPVAAVTSSAPTTTVIVHSEEEEKAVKSGKKAGEGLPVTAEEKSKKAERDAKAALDAEDLKAAKEVRRATKIYPNSGVRKGKK